VDRSTVTSIVVEVGPATVRGPNHADIEWVSAGIVDIDDELTLIDERPVAVADVWQTIMQDVIGEAAETTALVVPTWWATSRVDCVRDAAGTVAADVAVLRRADALRDALSDPLATVVEIAPEFVLVSTVDGDVRVAARADADTVVAKIPTSTAVVVDAPQGVPGAVPLAAVIADRLRSKGIAVTVADREWVRRSVESAPSHEEVRGAEVRPSTSRGRRVTAVLAGTVLSITVLCGGFGWRHDDSGSVAAMPMTLLVEGRLGVMVPAQWMVQRITSGPGSARLQVVSPTDADIAVHVTQSPLGSHPSRDAVTESLRNALSQQPEGVFVEFNPADRRADRPVMTYREVRADYHIAWVVLTDKSLRIAIGCQSAPGHEGVVREACDQAIRSAHAVF
jgi:type VII secretion-associated protein (TIGR03931 family)